MHRHLPLEARKTAVAVAHYLLSLGVGASIKHLISLDWLYSQLLCAINIDSEKGTNQLSNAENASRYLWVDFLRGIAILMVVLIHTSQCGTGVLGLPKAIASLAFLGSKGVQLFFLMSAFTIYLSFVRHKESEKLSVSNFYIRRFFRIAPIFISPLPIIFFKTGLDQGTGWVMPRIFHLPTYFHL